VARILIVEPHADIRALLELVVRRLGHEPVFEDGDAPPSDVDAAVIEPGEGNGLELARTLCEQCVPVLFTSIFPAGREALELRPHTYLVKPFPLHVLERALAAALISAPVALAAAV
jgi:DNA-binding response OmpR family regulator